MGQLRSYLATSEGLDPENGFWEITLQKGLLANKDLYTTAYNGYSGLKDTYRQETSSTFSSVFFTFYQTESERALDRLTRAAGSGQQAETEGVQTDARPGSVKSTALGLNSANSNDARSFFSTQQRDNGFLAS